MSIALWTAVVLSLLVADARWLRVAQREQYDAVRVLAIARLWLRVRPVNALLYAAAWVALLAGLRWPAVSLVGLALLAAWPVGLSVRPTTSPIAWTPRFRRLAAGVLVLEALVAVLAARPERAALLVPLVAVVTSVALAGLGLLEKRLSRHFVTDAQRRLAQVRPVVVGITGSYGKTSTKLYTAHVVSGARSTVASPASFNNLMGLSRTVNDRLVPGTEVFIAEMGTYGPGEIRELCEIFPPTVAAITTIGEAHLERMGTRATIVAAKSEIVERAATAVLNVDVPELADLAARIEPTKRVIRCSTHIAPAPGTAAPPDAAVEEVGRAWRVAVRGEVLGEVPIPPGGHPINLAIAVGIALALDIEPRTLVGRLANLPTGANRAESHTTPDGVLVIDDTYNSNPEGAEGALHAAVAAAGDDGRVFTVSPGMVELGHQQYTRNEAFAASATARPNMTLAVVARTNRKALEAGARGPGELRRYPDRKAATAAIMSEARAGDVVLYENDLPDHYP